MNPLTLSAVDLAVRSAFAEDFCAEGDLPFWSEDNPARGHCAIAALTMHDLFEGDLLVATAERDGIQTGYHYWNRLPGLDGEMSGDQFLPGEVVGEPTAVTRPAGGPTHYADQDDAFRTRVLASPEKTA